MKANNVQMYILVYRFFEKKCATEILKWNRAMKTQKIQIQGLNMKNNTNIQINKILELFTNIIIMNSQKKKVKK